MKTTLLIVALFGVIGLILKNRKQTEPVKVPVKKEKPFKPGN